MTVADPAEEFRVWLSSPAGKRHRELLKLLHEHGMKELADAAKGCFESALRFGGIAALQAAFRKSVERRKAALEEEGQLEKETNTKPQG